MRVISGSAKGKRLKTPAGNHTRPITDMIKEALFNVWGVGVYNAKLLDLFAGSGSVGIEALSRGADQVIFVDNSYAAVRAIQDNLSHCSFTDNYTIYRSDVIKAIGLLYKQGAKFDYIYLDPPFTNDKIFYEVMLTLAAHDILTAEGIAVVRAPRKKDMPDFGGLHKYRQSNYGESSLHYYCRCEEDAEHDGNISDTR